MSRRLEQDEIARQLVDLPGWVGDVDSLTRSYGLPDFPAAIRAVEEIAVVAEALNHHPDIDIRWRRLDFSLSTHDAGGVTQLDIELAHRIRDACSSLGGV